MTQVRVKEAAAFEVRLMDLLHRRFGAHAEELVVGEPVDPAVRVADELRVPGRALRGLGGHLDVQGFDAARRLRRRALLAPLDDAAGKQGVEDLGRGGAGRPADLQQGVQVDPAVDARQDVGFLGRQGQVLVARHRIRRKDGHELPVAQPLPEELGLREPPDPLDDDGGRRKRQRDVGIEDPRRGLEAVLPVSPFEGRKDDLLDEAAHFGVEHLARHEPLFEEDLPETRAALLGHGLQRPGQVLIRDPAAPFEERADPLPFARGRRGAQLPFLEKEVSGFIAPHEGQRALQALEEDASQDLGKGRLAQDPPKRGARMCCSSLIRDVAVS